MVSPPHGGAGRFTRTALAASLVVGLGSVVALGAGRAAAGSAPTSSPEVQAAAAPLVGYRMAASNGASYTFTGAGVTATGAMALHRPVVGMASTPDGGGYWLVASDGGIFAFGDARFWGSEGGAAIPAPIVGAAS